VEASGVSLSFWGGIDPTTGDVVDRTHPLAGRSVRGAALCLPSARGSCTASQVLLELVLNGIAPAAIVLRDVDGLACVGAIVAQEILLMAAAPDGADDENCNNNKSTTTTTSGAASVPHIVHVGREGYERLMSHVGGASTNDEQDECYCAITSEGDVILGRRKDQVVAEASRELSLSSPEQPSDVNRAHSPEEQRMLRDCTSRAEHMALEVIFRYAHIVSSMSPESRSSPPSAVKYAPIESSHIDGCTYIGPGGLEFVRRLVDAGGRVKVPTTLNSVSADRNRWKALGVPERYASNSIALGDAYLQLGCQPSFTCAPYLLLEQEAAATTTRSASPRTPLLGKDVAWGESNAVVYANSVLGARTEKYADYLDICCAIAGIVPAVGVHLPENRKPRVMLDATQALSEGEMGNIFCNNNGEDTDSGLDILFPVLGHLCGTMSDGKVPILLGLEDWANRVTTDHLKAFCAAFGTTASSPLIHIAGITPEAQDPDVVAQWVQACDGEGSRHLLTADQLQETFRTLDSDDGNDERVHLIALGNPHLSISECATLAEMVKGVGRPTKHPDLRVIACL